MGSGWRRECFELQERVIVAAWSICVCLYSSNTETMRSDPRRVSNVIYVCVCGVLCRQRLSVGPMRRPGSPNKCLASRQIPNLYRLDSRRGPGVA